MSKPSDFSMSDKEKFSKLEDILLGRIQNAQVSCHSIQDITDIAIEPITQPRAGWDDQFKKAKASQEEKLLMPDVLEDEQDV